MLIAIIGHFSRRHMADELFSKLNADIIFMDDKGTGANANHYRAIQWAAEQSERVIIIEDDALPVREFRIRAQDWLERFPDDLCSFYLGTGRPPQYQQQIAASLIDADKRRGDYITMDRLIHGVCYSPPVSGIPKILRDWNRTKAADYAVGDALGRRVIYPCYSLVDHADLDTVERHPDNQPRNERRRAWRLALFPVLR